MFIGHFASGLIFHVFRDEKNNTNYQRLSLFILVLGTQFVDVLWGIFTIFGIEGGESGGSVEYNYFDVPWSHSLVMMIVWSVAYGLCSHFFYNQKVGTSKNFGILAGFSVFSHWILDFIVHNDDMLLLPTSDLTVPSLYLWQHPLLTFIVESILILAFWYYYYMNLTKESDYTPTKKPMVMVGILFVLHIVNFLPSFSDAPAMSSNPVLGFSIFIGIILLSLLVVWFHPKNEISS